jgi:hypothetical protein
VTLAGGDVQCGAAVVVLRVQVDSL